MFKNVDTHPRQRPAYTVNHLTTRSALFAQAYLSENLGSLRYCKLTSEPKGSDELKSEKEGKDLLRIIS